MRQRSPRCPNPWKAAVCCSGGRGVEAGQKRPSCLWKSVSGGFEAQANDCEEKAHFLPTCPSTVCRAWVLGASVLGRGDSPSSLDRLLALRPCCSAVVVLTFVGSLTTAVKRSLMSDRADPGEPHCVLLCLRSTGECFALFKVTSQGLVPS